MAKLLNRLSEELYELRLFICKEQRIKTLEYEMSKLEIIENWVSDGHWVLKRELTNEEISIRRNEFIRHNPNELEFEKRKLEALKKYLKEQEENLTDLIGLKLI